MFTADGEEKCAAGAATGVANRHFGGGDNAREI